MTGERGGWWPVVVTNSTILRDEKTINCTTLITPSNTTVVFDAGWQTIPETIVFNLILFVVSFSSDNIIIII